MKPLVYIAAPYSSDPVKGTRMAVDMWAHLKSYGINSIVPHVSLMIDMIYPQEESFWYEYDLEIMRRCDAVLRLTGRSAGADREVEEAEAMNMPVFRSVYELRQWAESYGQDE